MCTFHLFSLLSLLLSSKTTSPVSHYIKAQWLKVEQQAEKPGVYSGTCQEGSVISDTPNASVNEELGNWDAAQSCLGSYKL